MDAIVNLSLLLRAAIETTTTKDNRIEKTYAATVGNLDEALVQDIALTESEVDHVIDFGEIGTSKLIIIKCDKVVSIKINGASSAIVSGKLIVLFEGAEVTAALLSNTEAAAAKATVVLAE